MTNDVDRRREDAALWQRAREAWRTDAAPGRPDDLTLAAYLDGALDDAAAAEVEAWLACEEAGLDLVLAARAALEAPAAAVPERLVRRAQDAVPARPRAPAGRGRLGGLMGRLAGFARPAAAWAPVAAAVLLAAASAFELGRTSGEQLAAFDPVAAENVDFGLGVADDDLI